VAALPFLLARAEADEAECSHRCALLAAAAAERAESRRRNSRGRVAWLLCEFGFQLMRGGINLDGPFALARADIADALGLSLCRVKRALAMLSLSRVVETDGRTMRILDWRRLCSIACYEARRLDLRGDDDDFGDDFAPAGEEMQPQHLTAAGDQACFV
jgi:hypothetical protein